MRREKSLRRLIAPWLELPNEADHDALDDELSGRDEVWVMDILGPEKRAPMLDDVALEGGLPVNERGDDVARSRLFELKDHIVALQDMCVDHGITAHFQGEDVGGGRETERIDVYRETAFLSLLRFFRHPGSDAAIERDVHDGTAIQFVHEAEPAGFPGVPLDDPFPLEGPYVADGGGLAGKAEVFLDFARRRHDARAPMFVLEEIEEFLLSFCQHLNSVPENTNGMRALAKQKCEKSGKRSIADAIGCPRSWSTDTSARVRG